MSYFLNDVDTSDMTSVVNTDAQADSGFVDVPTATVKPPLMATQDDVQKPSAVMVPIYMSTRDSALMTPSPTQPVTATQAGAEYGSPTMYTMGPVEYASTPNGEITITIPEDSLWKDPIFVGLAVIGGYALMQMLLK